MWAKNDRWPGIRLALFFLRLKMNISSLCQLSGPAMRSLLLILALLQLSACDFDGPGERAAHKEVPSSLEQRRAADPAIQAPDDGGPPPASVPAAQPVQPSMPAPPPANKPPPLQPKSQQSREMLVKAPAPVELDLDLPADLFSASNAKDATEKKTSRPLLPPLFGRSSDSASPFQLSGKLISGKDGDDYWDSIDGAELNFEFHQ
jgi:type IV secretory pathway VirB10-like protein